LQDKEHSLGERIYRGGIADRQIAACASCHSPTGVAFQPCTRAWPATRRVHRDSWTSSVTASVNNLQMNQVAAN
jgi:hypothetical protein